MAIYTVHTQAEVNAIPEPKEVWNDIGRIIVRTGEDMQEPPSIRFISVQEFRDRFTDTETTAFITASKTDSNVEKLYWKLATRRELLDLDSVEVQQGMLYLVSLQVITETRRIEILT